MRRGMVRLRPGQVAGRLFASLAKDAPAAGAAPRGAGRGAHEKRERTRGRSGKGRGLLHCAHS
jgi:hypothetical protein